ncbi:MAG: cation-translocating P-type ATPase [Oscillospiraceae bacterium]
MAVVKGLTGKEAEKRLLKYGANRLSGKKGTSIAAMFFSQFKDLMIIILAIATLISVAMGQGREAITIIAIVLINAAMGFFQEYRTEKTLQSLKDLSAPMARVYRDGRLCEINAQDVVQGDLIAFEAGDKLAADCVCEESVQLACDESMLTGESAPVHKAVKDKLFMGCIVAAGRGEGTAEATGMQTEMGKIATLMEETEEEPTPLQIKLKQLGKFVAIACVVICLAVGFLGYLQGNDFLEMLLTGISLAVAAIPEGLPAIVTITLALSVGRILRKGAVIRKLHAVETLGCAAVICTDKTGTVTQNKMTVKEIYINECSLQVTGSGYTCNGEYIKDGIKCGIIKNAEDFFTCAVLCNGAEIEKNDTIYNVMGDATETAILIAAAKAGYFKNALSKKWKIISETPFNSIRKLMSVTAACDGKAMLFCKGAPDVLLERCTHILICGAKRPLLKQDRENLAKTLHNMGQNALRVLAFAASASPERGETNMTFLGFMAMIDPPRMEVRPAVRLCRKAGIRPVMITGDHRDTAVAIAREVGIYRNGDNVLSGAELDTLTDTQLAAVAMQTSVYARVSPAHKLRIVRAYKAAGQVVAMTGDGVNDAPAVKEADIGVAMGISGTDVTKEASGVVILDDNFATIVSAVEEGRVIYQNIRRFIRFLLTSNLGEVLSMLMGMLLGLPVSLLPIQILLVNLFTDGLPAIALGLEPPGEDIMTKPPRPKNEGLFSHGLMRIILVRGTMLAFASIGTYWLVLALGADLPVARSACFLTIVFSQMLHIFECRGDKLKITGNPWLLLAVAASAVSAAFSVYLPIAQKAFDTASVTGVNFLIVLCAAAAGSVITFLLRIIKCCFRQK